MHDGCVLYVREYTCVWCMCICKRGRRYKINMAICARPLCTEPIYIRILNYMSHHYKLKKYLSTNGRISSQHIKITVFTSLTSFLLNIFRSGTFFYCLNKRRFLKQTKAREIYFFLQFTYVVHFFRSIMKKKESSGTWAKKARRIKNKNKRPE